MVGFRAPAEMMAAINAAMAAEPHGRSRSELIRNVVTAWLRERGYLPTPEPAALRPDELNSQNDV